MIEFVVGGIEHSGTTLVSDLFRQVPGLDSGFEVGVLMNRSPREFRTFEPYIGFMNEGWGVTDADLDYICDTDSFAEFYGRLRARSSQIADGSKIFDKTPRYLLELERVLERSGVPAVMTYKDPRSIVASDFKRSKRPDFDGWYPTYLDQKRRYMKALYSSYEAHLRDPRVAFVSLEELSVNTKASVDRIFGHVGLSFDPNYLLLKDLKFKNTHSTSIDMTVPFRYVDDLTPEQCRRVVEDFAFAGDWFFGW
ncbi:sulfotransferase [Microbacterium paludicola]|nr:sulfotransferase [Microbacterium paludicola]